MQTIDRTTVEAPLAATESMVEAPLAATESMPAQVAGIATLPPPNGRPRVVVVGAGFGGLNVVAKLARADVDVVMLDRHNYHGFWPLLYQVATAGLEPESIAYPARAILRKHPNAYFLMAEVTGVDFER